MNPLSNKWVIWYHSVNDNSWSVNSYTPMVSFDTAEKAITLLYKCLYEQHIVRAMLFVMKNDIKPLWEDRDNIKGGCFSFKIQNKHVFEIWRMLILKVITGDLFEDETVMNCVNGITVSPKKYFCIVKIWMNTCKYNDASQLNIKDINAIHLYSENCLFKQHVN